MPTRAPGTRIAHHESLRGDLPSGTVTFLFTDIEGSTKLLHELGADGYAQALAEHRNVLREAFKAHGGVEVDTQGDAFFIAFPTAPGALQAAADAKRGLRPGPIRVRIGIHTGMPHLAEEGYVGVDVHRAARIAGAGHGDQVLVSAPTAALVETGDLRDLGEHRLKDLSAPERIYQLGDGDFPPLKSLHQTNLPVPATPFMGREAELKEVLALQLDSRLVTLTGPGGTGKTRLALQAAGEAAERYPHGVWWVPLAPLYDPALVQATAAAVIGATDGLADQVADKKMLILFDNFEHVVEAATQIAELLAACPNLKLLVTSREPLQLTGEQEYAVPPLDPEEAVEFFLGRASMVKPDFEADDAIAEICRRLDDLPLALELAAARVKVLSPVQILERLEQRLPLLTGGARDLPERQRTLHATIEWSFELLSPEEQQLFARLAVFAGGCVLETAEQVAAADLDALQSLVDKSLVRHSGERFWMLETIREYAGEQLESSGDAEELRRRHAEHFLALAEEAEPKVREYSRQWLERLGDEIDNLRVALDCLESSGETQLVLRMAGALSEFWIVKTSLTEGRERIERALSADDRPTAARARALNGAADLAAGAGDTTASRTWAEEALALNRTLGDARGIATSLLAFGSLAAGEQNFPEARSFLAESARCFREAGDDHQALLATRFLAWALSNLGDRERARELYEEVLSEARAKDYEHIQTHVLEALAHLSILDGRAEEALPLLSDAYALHRELGDRFRIAVSVCRFAHALAALGHGRTAAVLLGCSDALLSEIGANPDWVAKMRDDTRSAIGQLDGTIFEQAWEEGGRLSAGSAVGLALDAVERSETS